jgi:hypothetical protein
MNIQKNLLFVSLLFTLLSCKKVSKEFTTAEFHLYNPVTGEAFSGVNVKIVMKKEKPHPFTFETKYESTEIWSGKTDENGKASYSFKAFTNSKYQYWPIIDQSILYSNTILDQPMFQSLDINKVNKLEWQIVSNANYVMWIKNVNCFDSNDKLRYRFREIETNYSNPGYWRPADIENIPKYFEGCYTFLDTEIQSSPQHIWEIETEIIRNGIKTTKLDTFYLTGKNGIDTLKLFY